jgi:DNA-binding NarL/FixJ family response regulator
MMAGVVAAYRSIECGDSNEVATHAQMSPRARRAYLGAMKSFGIGDEWLINGRGHGLTGAALYMFSHEPIRWSRQQRSTMQAVRDHVGTALRFQQKIAAAGVVNWADAILDRTGKVQHLSKRLRTAKASSAGLREAARASAVARLANKNWGQGWRFLDYIDRDGKAFVILCRADANDSTRSQPLSPREHQVVAGAALGASDKEIAYSLGIAPATVRVLLARASSKLGAHNRQELISRFSAVRPVDAR